MGLELEPTTTDQVLKDVDTVLKGLEKMGRATPHEGGRTGR